MTKVISNQVTGEAQGERIAKRIAHAGLCSRREAERWIQEGRVQVNGKTIETPAVVVTPDQQILVDGKPLPSMAPSRLWGYYKPTGIMTTHRDPQNRPTVFQQLPKSMPRVISIGRLDLNSEGLLLLTTDSSMARYAELPRTKWRRCYKVRVYGDVDIQALEALKKGITIEDIRYDRIDVDIIRQTGRNSWLFMTLLEGKNREIRRVLQHFGLQVNRLIRVAYGPFSLDTHQPGDLWEISPQEFKEHFHTSFGG
jgi:23S rRNA pseudouridine2605 synthase